MPAFPATSANQNTNNLPGFEYIELDFQNEFFTGQLPSNLVPDQAQFEQLWSLHPDEFHTIMMHGRPVQTPRWQQAFGADYHYTGRVNKALPIPPLLTALVGWCKETIDERLSGYLLNWYDGRLGHYIGKHRDSTRKMIKGAPIVTISFGEERMFRLRPWKGKGYRDFPATHGSVFMMSYETNLAWTHEVPHAKKYTGRRISVTARAFHKH